MNKAYQKIKQYCELKGVSPTPWAEENKIAPAIISRLSQGKSIHPRNMGKLVKAADGFLRFEDFYC